MTSLPDPAGWGAQRSGEALLLHSFRWSSPRRAGGVGTPSAGEEGPPLSLAQSYGSAAPILKSFLGGWRLGLDLTDVTLSYSQLSRSVF